MEGGAGITIKLWRMSFQEDEESYKTEESAIFIFPNQSVDALIQIKQLIQEISQAKNLFPGYFLNFIEDKLPDGSKSPKKEEVEEEENRIKLEPEPIQNFIDDSELWEDDEYDEDEDLHRRLSKRRKTSLKRKKKLSRVRLCSKCDRSFVWKKNFFQHLTECNPVQIKEEFGDNLEEVEEELKAGSAKNESTRKAPKGPFSCEKCPQIFNKLQGFKSHLKAHALSASVKDDSRPDVVEDTETEALGEVGPEAGKPNTGLLRLKDLRDGVTMKCDQCDLAYSNFQLYKNHMDQFHKKSLSCPDCGLKFTLENTLVKHKLDYHTFYPKNCDQCSKLCMTAKDLYEHLQSHTENFLGKTSPCEICGKLLKNKYSLKAHVEAVHEKRKGGEFACDMCGKILKSKASLDYHKRSVHTQEYPFRCDICGKGYIKYNRMVNCINNHQGIYKYRCQECDYKTNKLLQFKEHVNSHTGEKSYFCPACHHQSNGTKNLGCHTKQVHKLTLCQAEVQYKTTRFGLPMTEDMIEEMKSRMTSNSSYDEKIMKDLRLSKKNEPIIMVTERKEQTNDAMLSLQPSATVAVKQTPPLRLIKSESRVEREDAAKDYRTKGGSTSSGLASLVSDRDGVISTEADMTDTTDTDKPVLMTDREKPLVMQQAYIQNSIIL